MKRWLNVVCLASALIWAAGCNGSARTESDAQVQRVEVEVEPVPVSPSQREAFTYVERRREKTVGDYLLPWRWFQDDEREVYVTEFDEFEDADYRAVDAEVVEEDEGGPLDFLAFWKWGKKEEGPRRITESDVLGDMSPELATRAETKDETKIRRAKILDLNTRTIWDDLNHMFFFDRPSRLSLYPTP
jgi:hypothetical protein